jgi:hypothetical protein
MEMAYQSNTMLALFLSRLLGKEECHVASESDKSLLRLLTPVAKLYTAKQSIKYASELIEMFGGIGYLEDSGIPSILRDVQVLSIWEGTTNVLSLDMLRAIQKEDGLRAFKEFSNSVISATDIPELSEQKSLVSKKINSLFDFIGALENQEDVISASRDFAFYLAEASIALLWLDFLKTNYSQANYLNTLEYWLAYKMKEESLHTAELLRSTSKKNPTLASAER